MSQTYKTEGIILKRWDFKEQDRIMRILTREHGKITTRAISARKIQSKLAGHLEPFVHTDLHIAHSKTIDIVAGSNILASHKRLRSSLPHLTAASFFTEIVDAFTQEEDTDPELFLHVMTYLTWLDEHEPNLLALYAAIIQFFSIAGYQMELYDCHACKNPITEQGSKFYYALWNVECINCSTPEETVELSADAIKILRFLMEHDISTAAQLHVTSTAWREFHELVHSVLRYHHEGNIKSENTFLQMIHHT